MSATVNDFVEHFDFSRPDFRELPPGLVFEVYHRLRERGPVALAENAYPQAGATRVGPEWHIIGYEEAYQCAQDAHRLSSSVYATPPEEGPHPLRGSIIQLDPPEQNRHKKFINPYFAPARIRELETPVRAIADREIDTFIERGTGDLADVAWRVPGAVLFQEMLGFPVEDVEAVLRMVDSYMHPEFYGEDDPNRGSVEMYTYCYMKLMERRDTSSEQEHDVFDHLMSARVDDEALPFELVVANAYLLVIAGLETTSNALTNAFVWLGLHPEERQRLVEDPTMISRAVEEFVRFTGSVHGLPRVATEDFEVGGCPIKKGDGVQINWAAANRDPREFDNPDELIIDRDPNRHLGFGAGYHRCVGSNLARMEMRVSIEQVLARMPDYRFTDDAPPVYRHSTIPGYASIPVAFSPGKTGDVK